MVVRGLLIVFSGFIFIFSPGLVVGWLTRRAGPPDRTLLLLGVAGWLIATPAGLFTTSLLRQLTVGPAEAIQQAGALALIVDAFFGALMAALFLALTLAMILRLRRPDPRSAASGGLALGLGAGLVAHVFTGLGLIGAGFRILFGQPSAPMTDAMTTAPAVLLALGLLAVVLFRLSFIAVSGAAGFLLGRARSGGARWLAAAILAYTAFPWLLSALRLATGEAQGALELRGISPLATGLTLAYFALALSAALAWLRGAVRPAQAPPRQLMEQAASGPAASPRV